MAARTDELIDIRPDRDHHEVRLRADHGAGDDRGADEVRTGRPDTADGAKGAATD